MKKSTRGAVIAIAVAGLFAAGNAFAGESNEAKKDDAQVKCMGVNSCKGQGQCGGAKHDCAGMNECKGKGWIKTTKEECDKKGGTILN